MGIFANDTITLYNRHIDPEEGYEVYIATVIDNVNLVETRGANISSSGMADADSAKLYIDFSVVDNHAKTFVTEKEYAKLEDREKYFTFGTEGDFFVKGANDTDIQKYGFYEYMRENFDGVYKITNVDIYADVLPHYEIGGK